MTMTVNASIFVVATEAELDAIVQDNFPAGRPARSAVCHEGTRILRFRDTFGA